MILKSDRSGRAIFPLLLLLLLAAISGASGRKWPDYRKCESYAVAHGLVRCQPGQFSCTLECDFGYVPAGRTMFACGIGAKIGQGSGGGEEEEEARCVRPMAMVIAGRENFRRAPIADVEIFTGNASVLAPKVADFPVPVEYPTVLWHKGKVMGCGGSNDEQDISESRCWNYNPCQDKWEETSRMSVPRAKAVGFITADGVPYILGGHDRENVTSTSEFLNETSLMWTFGPELQTQKKGHCAISLEHGRLSVLTGGLNSYRVIERFDMQHGEHDYRTLLNHKRWCHACGAFPAPGGGGNFMVVAGGANDDGIAVDTVELWNPDEGIWEEAPLLPHARTGADIVVLDGSLTIVGGRSVRTFKDALRFDVTTFKWEKIDVEMTRPRAYAGILEVPVTLFDKCGKREPR